MLRKTLVTSLSLMLILPACRLVAQDAPGPGAGRPGRGEFAGMQRMQGEVTAVSGATISIKTEDGSSAQVFTTENTRIAKPNSGGASGQPTMGTMKVADLKPGDALTAMGNLDAPNKTLHAAVVIVIDAAQIKAAKANWGKTYVAGKVTAIDMDNAKMTIQRPDGSTQVTIGLDESTSFKRGRANINMGMFGGEGGGFGGGGGRRPGGAAEGESITLADVKVGDNVAGQGTVKGGVFVPGELTVGTPGQGRRRGGPNGAPAGPPPPQN